MRRIKWIGAGTLILVILSTWGVHTTVDVQVTTAPVTVGTIARQVFATGTLQPVTTVDVGTQVSGIVQSLEVDFNSLVRAGQVIARLDPSTYEAQLQSAKAGLAQAQADVVRLQATVDDANAKLARAEALFSEQLIPRSDFDDARVERDEAVADLDAARAAVVEATAAVNEASDNLSHTVIRSPVDGIVISREVDVGQTLAASVQAPVLFKLADDLKQMQLQVDVDESDVDGIRAGEPVTFMVDSYPDETFHGTVLAMRLQPVAQQTTPATTMLPSESGSTTTQVPTVVSYTTVVGVENPDERLRPGMTAQVLLDGSRKDGVIRIPNSALSFRPAPEVLAALNEKDVSADRLARDVHEVWRYDGSRLTPILVRAGLADDGWTELLAGSIHPGDALVISAVVQRRKKLA